jgi:5'-methylthioadenosine phosphorylase
VEMIIGNLNKNAKVAQEIVRLAVEKLDKNTDCECHHALENAIMTRPEMMRPATRKKLGLLIGKYIQR